MVEIVQSIHKKYVEKILSGEKTLELRKSKPSKIEYPVKVYLYESMFMGGSGMVVGEYLLKTEPTDYLFENRDKMMDILSKNSCLTSEEIMKYHNGKGTIYAWRPFDVVRYQEPKWVDEFLIDKAPQSWCYVNR